MNTNTECMLVYIAYMFMKQCYPVVVIQSLTITLDVKTSTTKYEAPHDKTKEMACAPSEDSYQPGHPPSLIRGFAVRIMKAWVLSYPLSAQRRL